MLLPVFLCLGGSESEIYIWDVNKSQAPMTPGPKSQPLDDVRCIAWNRQVQHILASAFASRLRPSSLPPFPFPFASRLRSPPLPFLSPAGYAPPLLPSPQLPIFNKLRFPLPLSKSLSTVHCLDSLFIVQIHCFCSNSLFTVQIHR